MRDRRRRRLVWKLRGGPQNRKVLGNDRLISMWPARAPVVYGDTVYWAAGIWPFMGVFVQAVDIGSGQPVWTNSGSGSNYTIQQHESPAFAGIAPQGYLTVNEKTLLVSGGMTVPAAFDRQTGRFLYYRPGDRELGKDVGGFDVLLGPDWFANHGGLQRLADGERLAKAPVDIITPQCVYGVAGKQLVASQLQIVRHVETTVDKKGKAKRTVKYKLPELWRTRLPAGITAIHLKTSDRFVASDGGSRVVQLNIPRSDADPCRVEWEAPVEGTVWRTLVADGRLIVIGQDGSISCFGPKEQSPPSPIKVYDTPAAIHDAAAVLGDVEREVAEMLTYTTARAGYAVIDQPPDEQSLVALAHQTQFHVIALQDDEQRRESLRVALRSRGLLGTRVAVVPGNLQTADLPPYLADLIVTGASRATAPADAQQIVGLVNGLRPYGGTALWSCGTQESAALAASCAPSVPDAQLETVDRGLLVAVPVHCRGRGPGRARMPTLATPWCRRNRV